MKNQRWVTNTVAFAGIALAFYGIAFGKIEYKDAADLLIWSGAAVGIGRKLDRIYDTQKDNSSSG
jgi:hypothetical protein